MKNSKKIKNSKLLAILGVYFFVSSLQIIDSESNLSKEDSLKIYDDYIDQTEDNTFFQKDKNTPLCLDDFILTNSERNIIVSDSAKKLEEILSKNLQETELDYKDQKIIFALNIKELIKSFLHSSNILYEEEEHHNILLYSESNDDLKWDQLFETLKHNNEMATSCRLKLNDGKYSAIESINEKDLKIWIEQFHDFINKTRKKIPNLNMKRLACILEDYSVTTYNPNSSEIGVISKTYIDKTCYPTWNGMFPDMQDFEANNYHEFYHILSYYCRDDENEYGNPYGLGFRFFDSFVDNNITLNSNDGNYHYPFNYRFIEEALAESFSTSLLNEEETTYIDNIFTINNLKLSLIFQQNFTINTFEQTDLLHNPIAFIQQFPILDGNTKSNQDWLVAQLEMLECYNIINDPKFLTNFCYNKDEKIMQENIKKTIICLENHADLQMTRNFLWNLANSKNTTKKDITFEDCQYLIRLYQSRLAMQRIGICKLHKISLQDLNTSSYQEELANLFQYFNNYIQEEYYYHSLFADEEKESITKLNLSKAFNKEEKKYFENLINEIDDYYTWLEEKEEYTRQDFLESVKTYYKSSK